MSNFVKCFGNVYKHNTGMNTVTIIFGVEQSVRHFQQLRSCRVVFGEPGISTEEQIVRF